jgi:hypothetical protein
MALKKCKECGNKVSTQADKCPHCGAKVKKSIGCLGLIVIFFLIGIFGNLFGEHKNTNTNSSSSEVSKSAKPKTPEAAAETSTPAVVEQKKEEPKPEPVVLTPKQKYEQNKTVLDQMCWYLLEDSAREGGVDYESIMQVFGGTFGTWHTTLDAKGNGYSQGIFRAQNGLGMMTPHKMRCSIKNYEIVGMEEIQ